MIGTTSNTNKVTHPVQTESPADHAGGIRCVALERSVVAACDIERLRPPATKLTSPAGGWAQPEAVGVGVSVAVGVGVGPVRES